MGRSRGLAKRNWGKEDLASLRGRRVWAAETPALLLKEPVKAESVGRRSGDENCGSELEVRSGYPDNGDSTFGGCGCGYVRTYAATENKDIKLPLSGEFGFFVGGHERG